MAVARFVMVAGYRRGRLRPGRPYVPRPSCRVRVMAKVGYARVPARGQNHDSQAGELAACGCGKIVTGKPPGTLAGRPGPGRALACRREGGVLVTRLSRAVRSLQPLLALAGQRRERGARVVLQQHTGTATAAGRRVFDIPGAAGGFQRELIAGGTGAGPGAARARGPIGGRGPKLNARQAAPVRGMPEAAGRDGRRQHTGAGTTDIAGVHRITVCGDRKREG